MQIKRFGEWLLHLTEETSSDAPSGNGTTSTSDSGPAERWQMLVDGHRIHFTPKFDDNKLQEADRQFVIDFLERFKYSKQKEVGNIFETKEKGVTFQIAYFGNQKWAACLINDKTREVTELMQITENKIKPVFELFDRAIDAKSFKDILPVKVK